MKRKSDISMKNSKISDEEFLRCFLYLETRYLLVQLFTKNRV